MSNRVSGGVCRNVLAFIALAAVSGSLAGCSSLGGFGSMSNDPTTTGSTAGAAAGNMAQSMPQQLSSMPQGRIASSGRYMPPADIGLRTSNSQMTTAAIGSSPSQPKVISQDLPSLNSSSAVGSTQTMPQQVPLRTPETVPAAVRAAPKLSVVAPQNGYTHIIESGESLYAIARKYKVGTDSIVQANGLVSADKIIVGQKLIIPGVTGMPQQTVKLDTQKTASLVTQKTETPIAAPKIQQPVAEPVKTATAEPVQSAPKAAPAAADGKFRWPVSGKVITDFAASRGTGINIDVPEGTAVRASESGTVIYVGSAVEGYGNLILVKHDNGFVSAYAHLSQATVAKGDTVSRGDAIGLAGMTGSVTRPQLHFELRKGATPVDPMPLLAS